MGLTVRDYSFSVHNRFEYYQPSAKETFHSVLLVGRVCIHDYIDSDRNETEIYYLDELPAE